MRRRIQRLKMRVAGTSRLYMARLAHLRYRMRHHWTHGWIDWLWMGLGILILVDYGWLWFGAYCIGILCAYVIGGIAAALHSAWRYGMRPSYFIRKRGL